MMAGAAFVVSACASSPAHEDLRVFLERREICDHLRGEIPDPSDAEAMQDVVAGIQQYCAGTDAQLRAMKRRFAGDDEAMQRLNALEPCIEGHCTAR